MKERVHEDLVRKTLSVFSYAWFEQVLGGKRRKTALKLSAHSVARLGSFGKKSKAQASLDRTLTYCRFCSLFGGGSNNDYYRAGAGCGSRG